MLIAAIASGGRFAPELMVSSGKCILRIFNRNDFNFQTLAQRIAPNVGLVCERFGMLTKCLPLRMYTLNNKGLGYPDVQEIAR